VVVDVESSICGCLDESCFGSLIIKDKLQRIGFLRYIANQHTPITDNNTQLDVVDTSENQSINSQQSPRFKHRHHDEAVLSLSRLSMYSQDLLGSTQFLTSLQVQRLDLSEIFIQLSNYQHIPSHLPSVLFGLTINDRHLQYLQQLELGVEDLEFIERTNSQLIETTNSNVDLDSVPQAHTRTTISTTKDGSESGYEVLSPALKHLTFKDIFFRTSIMYLITHYHQTMDQFRTDQSKLKQFQNNVKNEFMAFQIENNEKIENELDNQIQNQALLDITTTDQDQRRKSPNDLLTLSTLASIYQPKAINLGQISKPESQKIPLSNSMKQLQRYIHPNHHIRYHYQNEMKRVYDYIMRMIKSHFNCQQQHQQQQQQEHQQQQQQQVFLKSVSKYFNLNTAFSTPQFLIIPSITPTFSHHWLLRHLTIVNTGSTQLQSQSRISNTNKPVSSAPNSVPQRPTNTENYDPKVAFIEQFTQQQNNQQQKQQESNSQQSNLSNVNDDFELKFDTNDNADLLTIYLHGVRSLFHSVYDTNQQRIAIHLINQDFKHSPKSDQLNTQRQLNNIARTTANQPESTTDQSSQLESIYKPGQINDESMFYTYIPALVDLQHESVQPSSLNNHSDESLTRNANQPSNQCLIM
jgi:hypothetical protein